MKYKYFITFIFLLLFNNYISEGAEPFVLDEIISTARGKETNLKDIPGAVEVIDSKDILETNPVSISEILSSKPGISVSSSMPWSSQPVLRGSTNDQIILLVDGKRIVTSTAIPAQFGMIASGDIERIEVLKGPISVLYGSGSTGGIVNVITRKGIFTEKTLLQFNMNPSYESSAGGVSMYENLTWSNRKFYMTISQSNRKYGDYKTGKDKIVPNSQFEDRQTSVKAGLKVSDKNTLEAQYQNFSAIDVGIPGNNSFPLKATASYPSVTRKLSDVTWTWKPLKRWFKESKFNFYSQPNERKAYVLPNSAPTVKIGSPTPDKTLKITPISIRPNGKNDLWGGRWQNILSIGNHEIVAGIEGWEKDLKSERTRIIKKDIYETTSEKLIKTTYDTVKDTPLPDSKQRPIGVFAEDEFNAGKRLKITLGARIDKVHTENKISYLTYSPKSDSIIWNAYKNDDTSWSFITGAVYKMNKDTDLNIAIARSFRSPSLEERYLYADLGGKLTVGNPNLDSEYGTFYEGGFTKTTGSFKFGMQGFLNNLNDMVILQPGGTFNGVSADVYRNAGKASLYGFETSADLILHENILLSGDISYVRGRDKESHTNLPSIPPLKGHLNARWKIFNDACIQPSVTMVNKQDKVAKGERTTPGYSVFDLGLGYDSSDKPYIFSCGVKNILDKTYRDHLTSSRGFDIFGTGRCYYISVGMTYNK